MGSFQSKVIPYLESSPCRIPQQQVQQAMRVQILWVFLFLYRVSCTTYPIIPCNSSTYFNTVSMSCLPCPNPNQLPNGTKCLCQPGFAPSNSSTISFDYTCNNVTPSCPPNSIILETDFNGMRLVTPQCNSSCSGNTVPNSNRSACLFCGVGMTAVGETCVCSNPSYTRGAGGCYNLANWAIDRSSPYIGSIPNNLVGCLRDSSQLECSALMNICVFSQLGDAVCNLLNSAGYLYVSQSTFSGSLTGPPSLMLMLYLPTGNYVGKRVFSFSEISNCPTKAAFTVATGNNYKQQCTFSFNNVLDSMVSTKNTTYMYSLFIADQGSSNYSLIPVEMNINGKSQSVSRFFTADTLSVPLTKKLTVLTSFTLQMSMDSNKRLVTPKLVVSYSSLSINSGGTLNDPIQTLSYNIEYNHDTDEFNKVALPLLIIFSLLAVVQAALRTYIAYLNKRSPFTFLIYFGESWSSWMFFLLLGLTGYWFFFTKATATITTILPQNGPIYTAFYVVLTLMVVIRVFSVGWLKINAFKTDIFLIDWEVSPLKNCWREIFIANSLAEFFTFTTVSFGWIMIWALFFLVGISWENTARSNTTLLSWTVFSDMNQIMLYFISTSVLFAVGVVFKILRKILSTWWPHPFDDFADLCCLANISVYFPLRNTPVGFYIHGNNASGSEISLMNLNDAIIKGKLRKTNSLFNPGVQNDEPNTFILYSSSDLESKLSHLRREEEQMSYDAGRKKGYLQLFKSRQNFINVDLKRTLTNLPKQHIPLLARSTLQSYLNIPPIDLYARRDHIALTADSTSSIQDIFPNSDEFGTLISHCVIFGALNVGLKSSAISGFITYFLMEWLLHSILGKMARVHIEASTKVRQGFML